MRLARRTRNPFPDEARWTSPTLAPVPLVREILRRFVAVQAVDRGVAIGAHAFTAIVPMLMVYSVVRPNRDAGTFADRVIDRFDLDSPSADAIREALTPSTLSGSSVSFIGVVLLVIAALSFTRAVQRLNESAFGLAPRGFAGTGSGLLWLALFLVPTTIRPIVTDLDGHAERIVLALALSVAFWTATPTVLTGRRISATTALPAGLIAALAMTALSTASAIWLPHSVTTSAEQYGVIGVAFAFVSWLVGAGLTLAASTVSGAVIAEAIGARRQRRTAAPAPAP
jgi:membrane protein